VRTFRVRRLRGATTLLAVIAASSWACNQRDPASVSDAGGAGIEFDAVACTDANDQVIFASKYDQSCKSVSDCVAVGTGNLCFPCAIECPDDAINVGAMSQYMEDVSKTIGAKEIAASEYPGDAHYIPCGCPAFGNLACQGGKCALVSPLQTGDAGGE
jgi:hypothetical protein